MCVQWLCSRKLLKNCFWWWFGSETVGHQLQHAWHHLAVNSCKWTIQGSILYATVCIHIIIQTALLSTFIETLMLLLLLWKGCTVFYVFKYRIVQKIFDPHDKLLEFTGSIFCRIWKKFKQFWTVFLLTLTIWSGHS